MAEPYIGEIRMFGGDFAPAGWAFCNGQTLSIADYGPLFTLIGTTYGGDGQSTFALPNLQSRIPVHGGNALPLGQAAGSETVTLTSQQIPVHSHVYNASTNVGDATSPSGALLASSENKIYRALTAAPPVAMAQSIGATGSNQPHPNMMPSLAVSFIIALDGLFPTKSQDMS